ncbi:MAG: helix-turn-helix domain-containing protein [Clostridia bacterium]
MNSISKSDIDKIFGKVLKNFRVKNGFTQEIMAEKLGISLKYISRIENGYSGIKTQTLINYMNILGISPNTIFKEFMTSKTVLKQVAISEKLNELSEEKINFVDNMIDLLINFK